MTKRLDLSDSTAISMPVRNMLAIIGAVAVGVWAYFGVLERITMLETTTVLAEKDLDQHVEKLEKEAAKMINRPLYRNAYNKVKNQIQKLKDEDNTITY